MRFITLPKIQMNFNEEQLSEETELMSVQILRDLYPKRMGSASIARKYTESDT